MAVGWRMNKGHRAICAVLPEADPKAVFPTLPGR
jgi:hypothetical protein